MESPPPLEKKGGGDKGMSPLTNPPRQVTRCYGNWEREAVNTSNRVRSGHIYISKIDNGKCVSNLIIILLFKQIINFLKMTQIGGK